MKINQHMLTTTREYKQKEEIKEQTIQRIKY